MNNRSRPIPITHSMKTKPFLALLTVFSISLFSWTSHAQQLITATNSGNWSDVTIWDSGTVPGATNFVDVPSGINVTVDTNESVGDIFDFGTVTMGTNSTLSVYNDNSISPNTTLITTALGNTVVYICNPYDAKQCNYYNLVLANTNYVDALPPYVPWQNFNNFSIYGPTPMTIAGNWTLMGAVQVQQGSGGAPITIGGNLIIGTGCAWDCSGDNLTVVSNCYVYGCLDDLNAALGSNYIGGNVIVSGPSTSFLNYPGSLYHTNGWHVSDVTSWYVGGSLTNNGAIYGAGYGSISFNGTGVITGSNAITIPTMTVNGTYTIADTITLTTNTPILNGTLVFDLANTSYNTNQIILRYSPSLTSTNTTATNYYGGNLVVVNSGVAPVSGNSYKFFSASNYAGLFASETFPTLASGLSWTTNLFTSGSIAVTGVALGSPTLTITRSGVMLTLSWDSTTYPGFKVQSQTNSAGLHPNAGWSPTGSGTVSPYPTTINPAGPPVFYRLSNQ
jgi:hypothetical protein